MLQGGFHQEDSMTSSPFVLNEESGFPTLFEFDYFFFHDRAGSNSPPDWYSPLPTTPFFWEPVHAYPSPQPARKMETSVQSNNTVCSFTRLPDELVIAILSFLNVRELAIVGLVCKSFLELSRDDQIWKYICGCRWGQGMLESAQRSDGRRSRRKLHWQTIYKDRLTVEENWRRGHCSVSTIPYTSEITCIQLDETRIATGSYDTSVKVWDLFDPNLNEQSVSSMEERIEDSNSAKEKTIQPLRSLDGHAHRVYCLQFKGNRLLSGSDDTTMKMWDIDKAECLYTLTGHTRPIRCLQFNDDNVLVSGSYDKTVKVWDMEKQTALRTIDHFNWCVCCLKFDERVIVTGSFNKIELWDRNSGKLIGELEGHTNWITSLQFDETKIISGSMDSTIKIWDIRTRKCTNTLTEHQKRVRCVQYDNQKLCSGSYDHSVKIWDWQTGNCWVTLFGHTASARCLHYNDTHLVTGSLDKSIKIWDFSQTGTL